MNWLDLLILIPIIFGFIMGMSKGLIKELTSLAAIIIGIYGAKVLTPKSADFFSSIFHFSSSFSKPLTFLLIFILLVVGLLLLAKLLDKIITMINLGWMNRVLGGVLGGLKYALLLSVLLNIFEVFNSHLSIINKETKQHSITYTSILKLGPTLWKETTKETYHPSIMNSKKHSFKENGSK